jgi:tetraacyldisaccharide 4'-kinase
MDEAALHELLSGRQRGLRATLIRTGLHVASWLYSLAMLVRNLAYDFGLLRIHRSSVPVISIGNITTGGTGKTPFAAWLTNWLIAAGRKPGLLSRGYRSLDDKSSTRKTSSDNSLNQGNDEKLVLDRLCPGVPHLQQQDRVESAARAVNEFQCDVLILDDGFQHRRLHRDLDLVLIDALQPWGYEYVLPRGLLREDFRGLRRADLILITRIDQCSPEQRLMLRARLLDIRGSDEHVGVAFKPQKLVDLNWQSWPLDEIAGKKVLGFCGVGNPDSFRRTLSSLDVACDELQFFADHHHYDVQDLTRLANQARESSADVVLTTQKDLVKIASTAWTGPPLFAVEIGVEFVAGLELLEAKLRRVIA